MRVPIQQWNGALMASVTRGVLDRKHLPQVLRDKKRVGKCMCGDRMERWRPGTQPYVAK
jgi:hypothetical protein